MLSGKRKVSGLTLIKLLINVAMLADIHQAIGQGTRFFRISGSTATTITDFRPDGTLVWTNTPTNAIFTIQTATSLVGVSNWVDYVQIPITNGVNTKQIIDPNPPAGMAFIPAGSFTMGDTLDGESDAIPVTNVFVSGFYMDMNLVSYSQWQTVFNWATNYGYGFDNTGLGKLANHPVQTVNWYDCVKWCNARSSQAGLTPVYYTDAGLTQVYTNGDTDNVYPNWSVAGYRLPTEAEWEKAARGGLSGQRFPWGSTISESQANYNGLAYAYSYDFGPEGYNATYATGGEPYTSPVGSFAPNGYGLYDMAGNVLEWCWDYYGTPYAGGIDPLGPSTSIYGVHGMRVLRGGAWFGTANNARCACRSSNPPNLTGSAYISNETYGFRCVSGL